MNERFVEKWEIETDEELMIDELAEFIKVPNYFKNGSLNFSVVSFWNAYDKNGNKFSYEVFKHFVPKKGEVKGYIFLITYYKNGEQTVYIADSDSLDIDMDEISRKVESFNERSKQLDVFGELGVEKYEKATRIYNRFYYYDQQEDIEELESFRVKGNLKDYLDDKMTSYETVATAKIGPSTLSTVIKVHSKKSDKDFLIAVEDFTDYSEMAETYITVYSAELNPELVAYKVAD